MAMNPIPEPRRETTCFSDEKAISLTDGEKEIDDVELSTLAGDGDHEA